MAMRVLALMLAAAAASPAFQFHTDEFWLNLHHFLHVLDRAAAHTADSSREAVRGAPADAERGLATLSDAERQSWNDAVKFYAAGPSRKDAVFDATLPAVAGALGAAGDRTPLPRSGIDADLAATLERVAPVYRKARWPAHRAANDSRRASIQTLVDRHGAQVLAIVTKAIGLPWPDSGYPVHLS